MYKYFSKDLINGISNIIYYTNKLSNDQKKYLIELINIITKFRFLSKLYGEDKINGDNYFNLNEKIIEKIEDELDLEELDEKYSNLFDNNIKKLIKKYDDMKHKEDLAILIDEFPKTNNENINKYLERLNFESGFINLITENDLNYKFDYYDLIDARMNLFEPKLFMEIILENNKN